MPADLDPHDLRLLAALEANGALTNQDLAERVHLSASQCSRRRQRLEAEGYIAGYRAVLDAGKLGYELLVFIQVTLAAHNPDNARHFADLIQRTPEIHEAYMMTGDADYLLKARVRSLPALTELVNRVLLPHDTVARLRSNIVLVHLKTEGRLVS
jgi:DNA-binding Lrp family transcriptional regulator